MACDEAKDHRGKHNTTRRNVAEQSMREDKHENLGGGTTNADRKKQTEHEISGKWSHQNDPEDLTTRYIDMKWSNEYSWTPRACWARPSSTLPTSGRAQR